MPKDIPAPGQATRGRWLHELGTVVMRGRFEHVPMITRQPAHAECRDSLGHFIVRWRAGSGEAVVNPFSDFGSPFRRYLDPGPMSLSHVTAPSKCRNIFGGHKNLLKMGLIYAKFSLAGPAGSLMADQIAIYGHKSVDVIKTPNCQVRRRLPPRSAWLKWGFHVYESLARISRTRAFKRNAWAQPNEALTMEYITTHTTIPVPRVHGVFKNRARGIKTSPAPHVHAESIAVYHNAAMAAGKRPGLWMGAGVPELKLSGKKKSRVKESAKKD
ncbi:hypothetical protein C8F01DRAFT_1340041 [Mycena amicta]|nr:hypothetical protein C8F01DRAFT_1340041 [Mycena amicta]